MFKGARVVTPPERAPTDVDVVTKAISTGKPIAPKVQGRIKRLDVAKSGASSK